MSKLQQGLQRQTHKGKQANCKNVGEEQSKKQCKQIDTMLMTEESTKPAGKAQ